ATAGGGPGPPTLALIFSGGWGGRSGSGPSGLFAVAGGITTHKQPPGPPPPLPFVHTFYIRRANSAVAPRISRSFEGGTQRHSIPACTHCGRSRVSASRIKFKREQHCRRAASSMPRAKNRRRLASRSDS